MIIMSDKANLPLKVYFDEQDVKNLVKENICSNDVADDKLKTDRLLLKLMVHAYEEDERRNELIDTKNSQMIILTGAMLTLQSTLFTELLVKEVFKNPSIPICCKILLALVMLVSIGLYFYSMYKFINAYNFKNKFESTPNPERLLEQAQDNISEFKIQAEWLATFGENISVNAKVIEDKIEEGKIGFRWLKISGISTIIYLFLVLFFISCNILGL